MKRATIASVVGGIILFIWQFLSWGAINLHQPAQSYTPKQDAILEFLNSQQLEEGGYMLPSAPQTATMEEWETLMTNSTGKPWAALQYHHSLEYNNVLNMIRSLVTNILTILLLYWILVRMNSLTFTRVLLASLFAGLIVFLNAHYTYNIWYQSFDIWIHLVDAIVSWGLCGIWLGWYLNRKTAAG